MASQHLPQKQFLDDLRGRVLGDDQAVALVIGDIARWISQGRSMPEVDDLSYVEFAEFSLDTLDVVQPDVVLSPLVTDAFDAFQVISVLAKSGFKGRYRAVAPRLPDIPMIRAEVQSQAPGIDFDIVIMPPKLVSVS